MVLPVLLLSLIPISAIFFHFAPSVRSKTAVILYFGLLLFLFWGVGGLIFSDKYSSNELYTFVAFYIFIMGLHVPLLIKLSHTDFKRHSIKSARSLLGDDVTHLTDSELHYRLKH